MSKHDVIHKTGIVFREGPIGTPTGNMYKNVVKFGHVLFRYTTTILLPFQTRIHSSDGIPLPQSRCRRTAGALTLPLLTPNS